MLTLEVTEEQLFRCLEKHSELLDKFVAAADEVTWLRWQTQRSTSKISDEEDFEGNHDSSNESNLKGSRRKRLPVRVHSDDGYNDKSHLGNASATDTNASATTDTRDYITDHDTGQQQQQQRHQQQRLIQYPPSCNLDRSAALCNFQVKQEISELHQVIPHWMKFSDFPSAVPSSEEFVSQMTRASMQSSSSPTKSSPPTMSTKVVGIDVVRPFTCEFCPKRFTQKAHQQKHIRVHTGERPYRCEVCLKQFTQSSHLNTHMRIHTGHRPYQCSMCPQRFKQSNALHRHLQSHLGEKPFSCHICGQCFANKISLQRHHLTLHSIVKPSAGLNDRRDDKTGLAGLTETPPTPGHNRFDNDGFATSYVELAGLERVVVADELAAPTADVLNSSLNRCGDMMENGARTGNPATTTTTKHGNNLSFEELC